MELTNLTLEQRKAIAVFALQMMVADHTAVAAERRHVDWLERDLGVLGQIPAAEYYMEPDLGLFPDQKSRLALVAELFLVALADGHEHPDEHALLRHLIDDFVMPEAMLNDIRQWAQTPAEHRPALFATISIS